MKTFSPTAKKIKVVFVCDLCGVDVTVDSVDVPQEGSTTIEVVCPVCSKEFSVVISNGSIEIDDIAPEDITIEEIA